MDPQVCEQVKQERSIGHLCVSNQFLTLDDYVVSAGTGGKRKVGSRTERPVCGLSSAAIYTARELPERSRMSYPSPLPGKDGIGGQCLDPADLRLGRIASWGISWSAERISFVLVGSSTLIYVAPCRGVMDPEDMLKTMGEGTGDQTRERTVHFRR